MESNDTENDGVELEQEQELEPLILPIPISLSQLMGSLMVNRIQTVNHGYGPDAND